MRAEPNLFELCRAIATSTKSKECPKGLIAERWGVKSQVTLYQHIVECQQQHSTSVFLLLSHYVTAPLRKRSTWLLFTAITLIIKSISRRSSFCQRGAPRSGEELSPRLLFINISLNVNNNTVQAFFYSSVTLWQLLVARGAPKFLFSCCYIVEYQQCKYSAPLFLLLSHFVTAPLRTRSPPSFYLLLCCWLWVIWAKCSSFCSKRSSA